MKGIMSSYNVPAQFSLPINHLTPFRTSVSYWALLE